MRAVFGLLAAALMALSGPAHAQLAEGRDYKLVSPAQKTDSPGKIEVLEFFSYGCPSCFQFHPLIKGWAGKLPQDVVFNRVPAGFGRPMWANLAQTFYALEATSDLVRLDDAIFRAVHIQNIPMSTKEDAVAWVGRQGVDAQKFTAAFDSFSVNARLARAESLVRAYRVPSVPTLIVDGKYQVLGRTHEEMLAIADALIKQLRTSKNPAG